MFGTIGALAIGLQPASAISLTASGTINRTGFGCNNLTSNILDCYGFNNFDDSSTWLTAADGGRWAIKGTVIAATGTLSNATTGEGTAARVLTFTNATIEYKGGAGATSTFMDLSFFHDFDFTTTTTTRSGTVTTLFANPIVSHRLSGRLASSDGLALTNQVLSDVSFNGTGLVNGIDKSITYTDQLSTNSLTSGNPFGTSFTFYDAKDQSMASLSGNDGASLSIRNGRVSSTIQSMVLAQGDILYLPASECTVIHDDTRVISGGQNNGHGNGDQTAPGNSLNNNNAENSEYSGNGNSSKKGQGGNPDGNQGYDKKGTVVTNTVSNSNSNSNSNSLQPDKVEELCNKIARSVTQDPAAVPESSGAIPLLGGVMLWGASCVIRRGKF